MALKVIHQLPIIIVTNAENASALSSTWVVKEGAVWVVPDNAVLVVPPEKKFQATLPNKNNKGDKSNG